MVWTMKPSMTTEVVDPWKGEKIAPKRAATATLATATRIPARNCVPKTDHQ